IITFKDRVNASTKATGIKALLVKTQSIDLDNIKTADLEKFGTLLYDASGIRDLAASVKYFEAIATFRDLISISPKAFGIRMLLLRTYGFDLFNIKGADLEEFGVLLYDANGLRNLSDTVKYFESIVTFKDLVSASPKASGIKTLLIKTHGLDLDNIVTADLEKFGTLLYDENGPRDLNKSADFFTQVVVFNEKVNASPYVKQMKELLVKEYSLDIDDLKAADFAPLGALVFSPEIYVSFAWIQFKNDDFQSAIQEMESMFAAHPEWQDIAYQQEIQAETKQEFPPSNPTKEQLTETFTKYWALYHLGTGRWILVDSYMMSGQEDKALESAKEILKHYAWSHAWDPQGWFWSIAGALKNNYPELYLKARDQINKENKKLSRLNLIDAILGVSSAEAAEIVSSAYAAEVTSDDQVKAFYSAFKALTGQEKETVNNYILIPCFMLDLLDNNSRLDPEDVATLTNKKYGILFDENGQPRDSANTVEFYRRITEFIQRINYSQVGPILRDIFLRTHGIDLSSLKSADLVKFGGILYDENGPRDIASSAEYFINIATLINKINNYPQGAQVKALFIKAYSMDLDNLKNEDLAKFGAILYDAKGPRDLEVVFRFFIAVIDFTNKINASAYKVQFQSLLKDYAMDISNLKAEDFGKMGDLIYSPEIYVSFAWIEFNNKDYSAAINEVTTAMNMNPQWQDYAYNQGKDAKAKGFMPPSSPTQEQLKDTFTQYWALYHLGTAQYIRLASYAESKQADKAVEVAREILSHYAYAYSWDPQGWFWSIVGALKDNYPDIYKKAKAQMQVPAKKLSLNWLDRVLGIGEAYAQETDENIVDHRKGFIQEIDDVIKARMEYLRIQILNRHVYLLMVSGNGEKLQGNWLKALESYGSALLRAEKLNNPLLIEQILKEIEYCREQLEIGKIVRLYHQAKAASGDREAVVLFKEALARLQEVSPAALSLENKQRFENTINNNLALRVELFNFKSAVGNKKDSELTGEQRNQWRAIRSREILLARTAYDAEEGSYESGLFYLTQKEYQQALYYLNWVVVESSHYQSAQAHIRAIENKPQLKEKIAGRRILKEAGESWIRRFMLAVCPEAYAAEAPSSDEQIKAFISAFKALSDHEKQSINNSILIPCFILDLLDNNGRLDPEDIATFANKKYGILFDENGQPRKMSEVVSYYQMAAGFIEAVNYSNRRPTLIALFKKTHGFDLSNLKAGDLAKFATLLYSENGARDLKVVMSFFNDVAAFIDMSSPESSEGTSVRALILKTHGIDLDNIKEADLEKFGTIFYNEKGDGNAETAFKFFLKVVYFKETIEKGPFAAEKKNLLKEYNLDLDNLKSTDLGKLAGLIFSPEIYVGFGWIEFNNKDYKTAVSEIEVMLNANSEWQRFADEQEARAEELSYIPDTSKEDLTQIFTQYWALYHLGTAQYIRLASYAESKQADKAVEVAKEILSHYAYAYSWDPQGWFWSIVGALKDNYPDIYKKAKAEMKAPVKKLSLNWLDRVLGIGEAQAAESPKAPQIPSDIRGVTIDEYFTVEDISLAHELGINTVRSYITREKALLDALAAAKMKIIISFPYDSYNSGPGIDIVRGAYKDYVKANKDHPAIMGWEVCNEWNYHRDWYGGDKMHQIIEETARVIKEIDPLHPVFIAYGNVPSPQIVSKCPSIDIWGINIYSWDNIESVFTRWQNLCRELGRNIPMYISESGADSYDSKLKREDEYGQARADLKILDQVQSNRNTCLGITFMSWKDDPSKVEVLAGGFAYDNTANEAFWGLVKQDGSPKRIFSLLKQVWGEKNWSAGMTPVRITSEKIRYLVSKIDFIRAAGELKSAVEASSDAAAIKDLISRASGINLDNVDIDTIKGTDFEKLGPLLYTNTGKKRNFAASVRFFEEVLKYLRKVNSRTNAAEIKAQIKGSRGIDLDNLKAIDFAKVASLIYSAEAYVNLAWGKYNIHDYQGAIEEINMMFVEFPFWTEIAAGQQEEAGREGKFPLASRKDELKPIYEKYWA
ncbi:MAG: hypothetical protein WC486_04775, partial [Candidatus Omnitrophota bacterium]